MGADPRSPAEAGRGDTGSVGPGTCEQALEQERAANRDLVRKCAELDEVISGSQSLVRELRRDRDRLRRELVAAEDAALRADEAGRQADAELWRLRRELEEAAEELGTTEGTIRTQLKAVFSRLGLTRQTELAILVTKLRLSVRS